MNQIEPFREPIEAIKELLGSSYEREYLSLSTLCGLIRTNRPTKIVKVEGSNSSATAAVLRCVEMLELPCQLYVVDTRRESFPYTVDVFDLEKEIERRPAIECHLFLDQTPAACLDEIGTEIDLLILDAADVMPGDLLDFIAAFPYLAPNAMVALCGNFVDRPAKNVLFQNVDADKQSTHLTPYLEIKKAIQFSGTTMVSVFKIKDTTAGHMMDLFSALMYPWVYVPLVDHLLEYEASIRKNYGTQGVELYRQAIWKADPNREMLSAMAKSLFTTFPQVLLYGKGKWGQYFLKWLQMLGISITGFVVSDEHFHENRFHGFPVYAYSEIPFPSDEVLIIQTTSSKDIERQLRNSKFHWFELPYSFWTECEKCIYKEIAAQFKAGGSLGL